MNNKTFNTLLVVTVCLVVWAVFLGGTTRDLVIEFIRGQSLVSGMDTDRLTKVEVTKGEETVVLEKRGEGFLVVSRESYPADTGRINNLIQQCTGITCAREIGDSKDVHAELEVDGKSPESIVVQFFSGDEPMVGLIVGKTEDSGRYVRLASSDTVYLSEANIYLDTDALAYVDKDLTSLESVQSVKVSGDGQPYTIEQKDAAGSPTLQGVPEGMVAKSGDVGQVFNACKSLSFADFFPETGIKDVDFKHTYVVETEAGEQYTFKLGKQGEDWMCKASAKYVGPEGLTMKEVQDAKDDPEKMKKHEATLQASAKVKKFVNRHQSWVYKLAKYNAETLTKPFKDLIDEDKTFLKFDEKTVESVIVTQGEAKYTIENPEPGVIKIRDLPEGKDERAFLPGSVFRAVGTLAWQTRLKPDDKQLEGLAFDHVYRMTLRDKRVYTFQIAEKEAKHYLKAEAAFTGDEADTDPEVAIAKGAVAAFQKRHGGHVYEMPSGPVSNMVRPLADLIKDASELPKKIAASHILVSYKEAEKSSSSRTKDEAKARAESLLADVNKEGADFAAIAKENSDGPSKTDGGDLGTFEFEKMTKKFSDVAFRLKVGQVSGVVETEFGFHIIKRTQ